MTAARTKAQIVPARSITIIAPESRGDVQPTLKRTDASMDLIYLDPPFSSQRDYNLLFKTPKGQLLQLHSGLKCPTAGGA